MLLRLVYVLTLRIYDDVEGQYDGGGIIVVWILENRKHWDRKAKLTNSNFPLNNI